MLRTGARWQVLRRNGASSSRWRQVGIAQVADISSNAGKNGEGNSSKEFLQVFRQVKRLDCSYDIEKLNLKLMK